MKTILTLDKRAAVQPDDGGKAFLGRIVADAEASVANEQAEAARQAEETKRLARAAVATAEAAMKVAYSRD